MLDKVKCKVIKEFNDSTNNLKKRRINSEFSCDMKRFEFLKEKGNVTELKEKKKSLKEEKNTTSIEE